MARLFKNKIFNVVGSTSLVNQACVDIFRFYSRNPVFMNNIILTATSPSKIHELSPILKWQKVIESKQRSLIINAFPYSSYLNLVELNEMIEDESRGLYNSLNLIAFEIEMSNINTEMIIKGSPYYHDIYPVYGNNITKYNKLMRYAKYNTI